MNSPHNLSTPEFAAQAKVRPTTIRVRLCQTGSYFGVRPVKLPNGRLLWPGDSLEQLTRYRKTGGEAA